MGLQGPWATELQGEKKTTNQPASCATACLSVLCQSIHPLFLINPSSHLVSLSLVSISIHPCSFYVCPSLPRSPHCFSNRPIPLSTHPSPQSFPPSISHILLLSASSSTHPSRSLCHPRNLSVSLSCLPPVSQQLVQCPELQVEGDLVPPFPSKERADGALASPSEHLCTRVWLSPLPSHCSP